MLIRQRIEEAEQNSLSPMACLSINSKGRMKDEEKCEIRTDFQRDRDRIIHSKAFRRLKHKTQVFLSPTGDHYRTRLTHTLEVAQVARTISRAILLNEDLTEAIALGHDLGHTPFGHAGEQALNEICPQGFKHYKHSVRVVDLLEKNGEGLNLTQEVRNGILCHTCGEQAYTLEGRVVRLADRIAYINHDIEDAMRANMLEEENIPKDIRNVLGDNRKTRLDRLIKSVIENSKDDIKMSSEFSESFEQLHKFMFENVYLNPICKKEVNKSQQLIKNLYEFFKNNPDKIPNEHGFVIEKDGRERAVCDYIAGMTDVYALRKFNEIFVPDVWGE